MQLDGATLSYLQVAGLAALFGLLLGFLIYRVALSSRLTRHLAQSYRRQQDEFVALASHYLLNPITVIQTALARLQEGRVTDQERSGLYDAILRGEQRLWITAEQMLLVSQIDGNQISLKIGVGDLNDTLTGAITAVDAFARQRQVRVEFQDVTKSDQAVQVKFDQRRLKQAFIAVLDNAVKFSPEGATVKVLMSIQAGVCQVLVEDDGPGMPDEVVRRATQRFFRGTSPYNFDYEGMGLGLFIAKTIVGLHGGVITITSKPKRGTKVLIEFPKE